MALIHDDKPHKYRLPRIDAFGADRRDLIIEGVASVAEQHPNKPLNRWITPEILEREKLTIVPCAMFSLVGDEYVPRNNCAVLLRMLAGATRHLTEDQIHLVQQLGFDVRIS